MRLKITNITNGAVTLAAVATVPVIVLQVRGSESPWISAADWVIWSVFALDLAFTLIGRLPRSKGRIVLDVVVVTSFPFLPDALAASRLVRLTRVIRVVAVFGKALPALRTTLGRSGVKYVTSVTAVMVFFGGGLFFLAEPENVDGFWTGVWWAIVTATTVGYGDIAPQTLIGRLLGVSLMLCGIGLFAIVGASVAAYFVGTDSDDRLDRIEKTLERIEALVKNSKD